MNIIKKFIPIIILIGVISCSFSSMCSASPVTQTEKLIDGFNEAANGNQWVIINKFKDCKSCITYFIRYEQAINIYQNILDLLNKTKTEKDIIGSFSYTFGIPITLATSIVKSIVNHFNGEDWIQEYKINESSSALSLLAALGSGIGATAIAVTTGPAGVLFYLLVGSTAVSTGATCGLHYSAKNIKRQYIRETNYISAFKQILNLLSINSWEDHNILIISMDEDLTDYGTFVQLRKVPNIVYKKDYSNSFIILRSQIEKYLNKNS